jgi:hypothetical protein
MSLPSVRKELNLDNLDNMEAVASWPARMKKMVVDLAMDARQKAKMLDTPTIVANSDLLTAYNGAAKLLFPPCEPAPRKRDDIPGDPFPQTVCIRSSAVFRGMPVKHRIRS